MFQYRDPQSSGDLEANRQGEIPRNQAEYIHKVILRIRKIYVVYLLFPVFFFIPSILFLNYSISYYYQKIFQPETFNSQTTLEPGIFLTLIFTFISILGIYLLIKGVRGLNQISLLRKDLKRGEIAEGDGEMVLRRGQYVIRVNNERLRYDISIPIPPATTGKHHFYYLPRSRWILSAELLEKPNNQNHLNYLSKTLATNAQGKLTTRQIFVLLQSTGALFFVPGAIIFVFLLINNIDRYNNEDNSDLHPQQLVFVPSAGCLVFLVLTIFSFIKLYGSWRYIYMFIFDAFGGRSAMIEGILEEKQAVGTILQNYFHIGGLILRTTPQVLNHLNKGESYQIFYTPRSKYVLSYQALKLETAEPANNC